MVSAIFADDESYIFFIQVFSSGCALTATILSVLLISKHLRNFRRPLLQSKIVGILWMVPIYSVDCALSLWFPRSALFIDMARDCYEAYVLYLFFALLLGYVSNGDEYALVVALEQDTGPSSQIKLSSHGPTLGPARSSQPRDGAKFLRYCKFGTLQYCVVRPITTFIAGILDLCGLYKEEFNPLSSYFWIMLIINISITQALVVLIAFYQAMKDKLENFDPFPKFICIKAIIFFAFWQGVLISCLVHFGVITTMGPYGPSVVAGVLQNFLICLEMPIIAIAHSYAFSVSPYLEDNCEAIDSGYISVAPTVGKAKSLREKLISQRRADLEAGSEEALLPDKPMQAMMMRTSNAQNRSRVDSSDSATSRSFEDPLGPNRSGRGETSSLWGVSVSDFFKRNFAYTEAIRDFNSSMPVVTIPSGFTPGRGQSVVSNPKWRAPS